MNSLRRHLTRELLLVFAALLAIGLTALYFTVRMALEDSFEGALHARAHSVSALTEFEGGRVQFDFSEGILHDFGATHMRHFFEVRDAAGAPLARSPSLKDADLPRYDGKPGQKARYWDLTLPDGRRAKAVAYSWVVKAADPGKGSATVSLVAASDRTDLDSTLTGLVVAVAGVGALLLGAVLLVVPRVLRRGMAPLDRMGEQAARIDADSLAARFAAAELPDELRAIGVRLNDLLARLEASFERERRFGADLAHELRTPLAELRSVAECAIKWPDSRDEATDRDVLAITAHMEGIVTQLLVLVRNERGLSPARTEPVELAALVARAWQPFSERAAARGLRATFDVAPATVAADPVLLQSILRNLFDNAVDHAPAGSEVRVEGAPDGAGYALRMSNPAPDLTAADAGRLFDRLWRKEASRSGGEHVGLGLSLARAFAAAMGWSLDAVLDGEGWLEFVLKVSVAAPRDAIVLAEPHGR